MIKSIATHIACIIFIFLALPSEAQILKKVLNETKGKLGQSLEDIVVDKASDILVKKINHSLNKHIDQKIEESFKDSEFYNEEQIYNSSENQIALNNYLSSINANVTLPDSYHFDVEMLIEMREGNEKTEMKYFFSKTQQVFGFSSIEDGEENMMVYDIDNNAAVIYMKDENGQSHAQAIPMNNALVGNIIAQEMEKEGIDFSIRATGKTAIVAGKTCKGYIAEGDDTTTEFFTSDEVAPGYANTFGSLIDDVSNSQYNQMLGGVSGMMMKAITIEDNKEFIWEVMQINNITKVLSNR